MSYNIKQTKQTTDEISAIGSVPLLRLGLDERVVEQAQTQQLQAADDESAKAGP